VIVRVYWSPGAGVAWAEAWPLGATRPAHCTALAASVQGARAAALEWCRRNGPWGTGPHVEATLIQFRRVKPTLPPLVTSKEASHARRV
jgi:hypothetical protein